MLKKTSFIPTKFGISLLAKANLRSIKKIQQTNKRNFMNIKKLATIPLLLIGEYAMALPIVQVNFIFATPHVEAQKFDNPSQIKKEVDILNRYFVTEKNQPIFKFELNKYIPYQKFKQLNCKLSHLLESPKPMERPALIKIFRQCFPSKSKEAEIYIFIFDSYSSKSGFKAADSWGFHNNGRPIILLDWERLNYNIQAALPHEMGHAFGLRHVCVKGAKFKDTTNLMASKGGCDGSGGQRNIGFNDQQIQIIKEHYQKLKSR